MMPRIKPPRLLPITIFALAGLLAMKSVELVRVAAAAVAESQAVVTTAQAASPAAPEHMPPASPSAQPAATPSAQPAATPAAEDSAAPVGDGERTVLLELRKRRQELDSRETALAARESLMAATEQKLSGRVAELQTLQKKLEALEATRQEREDTSWQRMVKLYETMKPRDAATIFNDLEMPVLLQVLDRMKEAKAAPVLAAMQPDKARDVTAQIARLRTTRDGPGTRMTGG
jgi:flagellar motility protein MotE (MotC chaperone)